MAPTLDRFRDSLRDEVAILAALQSQGSTEHCDLPLEGRGEPPAQHPALDRERPGDILADEGHGWPGMAQDVRWPAIGAEGPRPGRQIDANMPTAPHAEATHAATMGNCLLGMGWPWSMAHGL